MKLELHHINLSTRNVKELERFYKDILFLDTQTEDLPTLEKKKGYSGDVSFVGDGKVQMNWFDTSTLKEPYRIVGK